MPNGAPENEMLAHRALPKRTTAVRTADTRKIAVAPDGGTAVFPVNSSEVPAAAPLPPRFTSSTSIGAIWPTGSEKSNWSHSSRW